MIEHKVSRQKTDGIDSHAEEKYVQGKLNYLLDYIMCNGWKRGYRNSLAVNLGIIARGLGMEEGDEMQDLINKMLVDNMCDELDKSDEDYDFYDPAERIDKVIQYAGDWITISGSSVQSAMERYGIPFENKSYNGETYVQLSYES